MKYLCALFLVPLLLNGCSSDAEDRRFFEHGWVHPGIDHEDREFYHSFFWDDQ